MDDVNRLKGIEMREYGKVSPRFWTGETGRKIRDAGGDAQRVALYLLTCPMSSMIGLYYLPLPTLAHEVGIPLQGASKALQSLSEALFAHYDHDTETVWVPEMAAYQIGEPLKATDNRVVGIHREWQAMRKCRFYMEFHARYAASYHLPEPKPLASPLEAPCKPLRSQEHEQEQDQDQEEEQDISLEAMTTHVFSVVGNPAKPKWSLSKRSFDVLSEAFPRLDIDAECRKAIAWCELNPGKRKTAKGMGKFLHGWMERAMQKGGTMKPLPASSRIMTMEEAQNWSFD